MKTAPDEIHARAGLIASEFSLLGLGAGLLAVTALAVLLQARLVLPIVRPALAAGAGLVTFGVAVTLLGRWLNLGGSRKRPAPLPFTFWPLVVLGLLLAATAWTALGLHAGQEARVERGGDVLQLWGPAIWLLLAAAGTLGVPLLAGLGLRALAAVEAGAPLPVGQLFQSISHVLLGGLALFTLLTYAADQMTLELRSCLATAMATLCGHTMLWTAYLLRGSRRALGQLRAEGVRVPVLERGHRLASAALVFGVLGPGLVVLADLVLARDTGLAVACSLLAVSGHAMRYAWVLLGWHEA